MTSGAKFTKVVVIQSLSDEDPKTGKHVVEYINGLEECNGIAELVECSSATQFLNHLRTLEEEIRGGKIPLLHVECHGHLDKGLFFADKSSLSWQELVTLLRKINQLTRFNLVAVFSACFGGYFLSHTGAIEASPFWAFVAPTSTVDDSEIMRGFRVFYSTLFHEKDVGKAAAALRREELSYGSWFGESAEKWFLRVVIGYVKTHCNAQATLTRTRIMYRTLRSSGVQTGIGRLKRTITQKNRAMIPVYFDRFFMTQEFPENKIRFAAAKRELENQISKLKSRNTYSI